MISNNLFNSSNYQNNNDNVLHISGTDENQIQQMQQLQQLQQLYEMPNYIRQQYPQQQMGMQKQMIMHLKAS